MAQPIILSDEEDQTPFTTPLQSLAKKPRTGPPDPTTHTILVLDDDPTPQKPGPTATLSSTPSFVAETPMSDLSIVKCTMASSLDPQIRVSSFDKNFCGSDGLICLESDNESENGPGRENLAKNEAICSGSDDDEDIEWHSRAVNSSCFLGNADLMQMSEDYSSQPIYPLHDRDMVEDCPDKENFSMEQMSNIPTTKRGKQMNAVKKNGQSEAVGKKKKMTKEERMLLMEEKKQKKEQEKLQKAALKAEAAELKKLEKEKQKWEKGKFAQKSIVAEIDTKVVELGSVGGHLLSRFAEKGFTYRITSNPIERSIVWTMTVPEHISQLSPQGIEIQYVLLVYEAEEFCNLVLNESLMDHVSRVRRHYPSYSICFLTNRLMAYINKREKEQYKNPANSNSWRRPPVEEVLAKLTTHFVRVHSRQCIDEAELAEHVVGLTSSLGSCQFRKKLTRLSVNANGLLVPKDSVDRNLIKKSPWLKALVAIPKVQPRFAIAIWKKYPTMKALLSVYMDPSKSVHEKEFLLKDLTTEGLLGGDRRLGEVCSKRVYRVLMAQSGTIKTDDVEDGADFFRY
ncbi:crossover junction endonuclease EME1B-like isoform X1 [Pistacia vera]|uniref:crossover junction endonuclease EME1B-like isoform X1 n=1 Tax=Pistacia vera TaxID=55513 RepID=UPI001263CC56|nr:crossover junction endonuclease EME1B-like isoform X1 [Pistacia vera]